MLPELLGKFVTYKRKKDMKISEIGCSVTTLGKLIKDHNFPSNNDKFVFSLSSSEKN